MAQKTNPTSLRLQKTNKSFNSCWYSNYFYTDFLVEELKTRSYIERVFNQVHSQIPQLFVQKLYKNIQLHAFFFDPRGTRQQKEHRFILQRTKSLSSYFKGIPLKWSKKEKDSMFLSIFFKKQEFTQMPILSNTRTDYKKFSNDKSILVQQAKKKDTQQYQKEKQFFEAKKQTQNFLRYLLLQTQLKNTQNLLSNRCQSQEIHNTFLLSLYDNKNETTGGLLQKLLLQDSHTFSSSYNKTGKVLNKKQFFETQNKFYFKHHFENTLSTQLQNFVTFDSIRVLWEYQNADFLAEEVVFFLQRRVTFRRIKDYVLKQVSGTRIIKGIRLSCSGRLGGRSKKAQKAKMESIQWGQTSLNVFSSKLCFASKSAFTPFGKIGVKVWLCYK